MTTIDQLVASLGDYPGWYEVLVEVKELDWDEESNTTVEVTRLEEPELRRGDGPGTVVL